MKLDRDDLIAAIARKKESFRKRVLNKTISKYITSKVTMGVAKNIDPTMTTESFRSELVSKFSKDIFPTISEESIHIIESGLNPRNVFEKIGTIINKYVSMESEYRYNLAMKSVFMNEDCDSIEAANKLISRSFESDNLNSDIATDMHEELESSTDEEIEELVEGTSKEVKESIDDAEEKAEVTRTVIIELKTINEKIEDEKEVFEEDDKTNTEESLNFDATKFIKGIVPVSVEGFELSADKLSKKTFRDMIYTLEEKCCDVEAECSFVSKRINAIREDGMTRVNFNKDKLNKVEDMFTTAKSEVDKIYSGFTMLGFGKIDKASINTDKDTLTTIKTLAETPADKNVTYITELVNKHNVPNEITSEESFIKMAVENFDLKSTTSDKVLDYEGYAKAVTMGDETLREYLVQGMGHVPESRLSRLREIKNGLDAVANNNGGPLLTPKKMKTIYYKTCQATGDKSSFVDLASEHARVKDMVKSAYSTNKYDSLVDDLFNNSTSKSHLSEENLYEVFAYNGAMSITKENMDLNVDNISAIKITSKLNTCLFKSIKNMGIISHDKIVSMVQGLKM